MQDKILEIAKGLGYEAYISSGRVFFSDDGFEVWGEFNPYENDANAFKVLEALVARLIKTANARLQINDDGYLIVIHPDSDKTMFGLFDRGSICEAYLSLIQQEEG